MTTTTTDQPDQPPAEPRPLEDLLRELGVPDDEIPVIVTRVRTSVAAGYPMVERCCCNQPDDARVKFHRRGDQAFCRDTFEVSP